MRFLLSIIFWLDTLCGYGQVKDSSSLKPANNKTISPRPEILSGGFIDIVQNGQMNASARLFRLYIGEPGKFQLPVSVFTGVSANSFSNSRPGDDMALVLINPGAGIFNISVDGVSGIAGKKKITSFHLQYQAGLRFLGVYDRVSYKNYNFSNLIAGFGFTLVTGAWERNKTNNMGFFWINLRGIYSGNPAFVLKQFFPTTITPDLFGYSGGLGIEISQALNVKVFYFRFLNNLDVPAFVQPFIQLSFNYSVK